MVIYMEVVVEVCRVRLICGRVILMMVLLNMVMVVVIMIVSMVWWCCMFGRFLLLGRLVKSDMEIVWED